ncbi:PH domain-containing protein [Streptomyces sp. S07_1.15]|uniref:PH domain-containing protein n=1 Tax=Streptomyces sp. S07_1.15 TaxID=2873925 RepID=UPI001D144752|nr:PH domain-containing protein [Streptomyces sp. S07_1.15]MCC3654646.1 PH domain-containing protein [Streptomyces sp. S07_1.15]
MTTAREVTCHSPYRRTLGFFLALGVAGAVLAVARAASRGTLLDMWLGLGLFFALVGFASVRGVTAEVRGDAYGLHSRTLLRRRSVPWRDIADLRIQLRYPGAYHSKEIRRVGLVLRDGRRRLLPLPSCGASPDPEFDAKLDVLRALHRRYGAPESDHRPVVSSRTAGGGWAGSLTLCALLLAGAGVAASFVPGTASEVRAWRAAVPCAAEASAAESRADCLSTVPAVIERTEVNGPKQPGQVYFSDGRPLEQLSVSQEAAQTFRPGDRVELAVWRGEVMEVAGERHVWHKHVVPAGDVAVLAAVLALAAGYPGARVLLRLRGRRLPDDEVLPSALPFVGALAGTALWLLPLCYLHPTTLFTSPVAVTWAAAGSLVTLGLLVLAWRATRVRGPGDAGAAGASPDQKKGEDAEVFLSARFLEHTDYNPHHFGTHIVLGGGGPPAVTPHPGPGRFAAKPIPVERLTVREVRRVRGDDSEAVPRSWHIAELDDAGRRVRLAAAPADLIRVLRELGATSRSPDPAATAASAGAGNAGP